MNSYFKTARPLNIGIDARILYMPILKGMGVYLNNLLLSLSKIDKRNKYILYFDSRQKIINRGPKAENFITKGISLRKGDRVHLWEHLRLPLEVIKDKIDVFHSPANTTMFFSKCPILVTIHDTILQELLNRKIWSNLYFNKFQPWILRKAQTIITPSSYSKIKIAQIMRVSSGKIKVIPNGISSSFKVIENKDLIETIKSKYNIRGKYLLNVGGQSPWKNVSSLIKAYSILANEHKLTEQLIITGISTSSIVKTHLKEVERLGLLGTVLVLGYVSEDELVNLYNGAELLVYPSLMEGFGFPPLEAMACGTPVVASKSASIPEIVGDAGVLVDVTNLRSLSEAMLQVLQNKIVRENLIKKGFERSSKFSWERTAEQTLNLYIQTYLGI